MTPLAQLGLDQLSYQIDDMAGWTELAVFPDLGDFGKQVFVGIPLNILKRPGLLGSSLFQLHR